MQRVRIIYPLFSVVRTMTHMKNRYMKLGLQGHTIVFASGDSGVAGPPGDQNPNGCMGSNGSVFNPGWPNSCPYVTNVGATKIMPGKQVTDPEWGVFDPAGHPFATDFSSGGGFSNIFSRPQYQNTALAALVVSFLYNYCMSTFSLTLALQILRQPSPTL